MASSDKASGKKRRVTALVILALLLAIAADTVASNRALTVSRYEIRCSGVQSPLRIVQLSDLHSVEFGSGNRRLLEKIAALRPDLILLTGDMLTETDANASVPEALIARLAELAPVYACMGNHELAFATATGIDPAQVYAQAGAKVLQYQYEDIELGGAALRLGGLYGYCFPEGAVSENETDSAFLREFLATDRVTLLLCHLPLAWIQWHATDSWHPSAVFCGHTHGGQLRLPFIGALYAPEAGLFPGTLSGLYPAPDGQTVTVLSRGLGGAKPIPRFHNIPEIVAVDLLPAEG